MKRKKVRRSKAPQRKASARAGGDAPLLRLVICGAVFVLLVAVKLLFPQIQLSSSLNTLLGRDADFREAFAAVGRAVSGEESVEDSLEDAYTAVFRPQQAEMRQAEKENLTARVTREENLSPAPETEPLPVVLPLPVVTAEEVLEELTTQAMEEEGEDGAIAAVALPDNVSYELRDLGFPSRSPIVGKVTSLFGWRDHPVTGGNKFHYGVDVAAAAGTAITAFADGTVYATGESSTLGNYIMLRHDGGYVSLYAHCSRVVRTGGSVTMGEKIAEVGETGTATGPHLHFELQSASLYLNPLYYMDVAL